MIVVKIMFIGSVIVFVILGLLSCRLTNREAPTPTSTPETESEKNRIKVVVLMCDCRQSADEYHVFSTTFTNAKYAKLAKTIY